MSKKIIAMLLALVMVFALVACGGGNTTDTGNNTPNTPDAGAANTDTGSTAPEVYPEKTVLIGVEVSDPTEAETIATQEYFAKLAETMNVEFKYSEKINNADDEMAFIEDCAIAGCQGFISNYNVTGAEQIRAVIGYGMYYYGMADDEAIYNEFKENEYYLGSTNSGNSDYERGKALGQWVVENGYDKVVYANGGADFGVAMFVARQTGFYDGLGDADVEVIVVSGFPGDAFFAAQSAALSEEGLDAVCASFSGVNFWAQPIVTAGLSETVSLATIGALDKGMLDAFESGALSYLLSSNVQRKGLGVALICNAVDGNGAVLRDNGLAMNIADVEWRIDNYDMCKQLFDIMNNELVFSAEDLMSACIVVNPDASYQTLVDLVASSAQDELLK